MCKKNDKTVRPQVLNPIGLELVYVRSHLLI